MGKAQDWALNEMDDASWSEWRGVRDVQQPRPLSQGELALLLRPFRIRPRTIWPRRATSAKGYYRHQFKQAWRSYCGGEAGCDVWAMARHASRAAYAIDVSACFPAPTVGSFLPWLMLNRDGLSILLHPGTGDAYADHIDHAVWLGSVLTLRRNVLRKSRKTPSHS